MPGLRIGLIGCGRIAQQAHIPALTQLPGVELATIADVDSARREASGALAPRAATFADWRDLLRQSDVEAW